MTSGNVICCPLYGFIVCYVYHYLPVVHGFNIRFTSSIPVITCKEYPIQSSKNCASPGVSFLRSSVLISKGECPSEAYQQITAILQSVQVQNKATDAADVLNYFGLICICTGCPSHYCTLKTGVSDICFVGIAPPLLSCSPM